MARILRLIIFAAIAVFSVLPTFASHVMGTNLTYECIAPGQYKVSFTMYRDCSGIAAEASQTISYRSAQCGINSSVSLSRVSGPIDVTPICPGQKTSCNGNGQYGVQRFIYQGTLNLPAGCGNDWILSWDLCCRNASISTLSAPDNQGTYIEARLNNTLTTCNTSPYFLNDPVPFFCTNQAVNYNHGVVDIDGDSLVFSFATPYNTQGVPVTYQSGYTYLNPINSSTGFNINPANGDITFTPTTQQIGVTTVRVDEYRNGVLIGSVFRDMQFIISNCNNNAPTASGINGTNVFKDSVCAGALVSFNINSADVNGADIVSMAWNNAIAGATFTTTTSTPPVGTFNWTPSATQIGTYTFTVQVKDNACPLVGTNTYSYTIVVRPNPNPPVNAGADVTICQGQSTTLNATTNATNGSNYTWTDGTNTFSGPSITVSPTTTTVYTVSLDYTDACSSSDNLLVKVDEAPVISTFPASAAICAGNSIQLTASSTSTGTITYNWFPTTGLSCSNCPNPIATSSGSVVYNVVATNTTGCTSDTAQVSLSINATPPSSSCEVIYVTTTGSGNGSQLSPTNLYTALGLAACNNSVIKMAVGTYTIDTAITSITSYTTLEGGFDPITWEKTSLAGATVIYRTANNLEGPNTAQRLVAIYMNSASYFRFQDITIQTADVPASATYGISNYGLHFSNCSNYDLVRCQIIAGNASAGTNGVGNPVNGVNGTAGTTATGQNGGAGGCTNGICGGTGGRGGNGSFVGGSSGAAGTAGQNGGGAGGAGGGGGTTCQQIGGANASRPGLAGANGAVGIPGAVTPGAFIGGFYSPGSGANGTAGGDGTPGGGGGGAGGSSFNTDGFGGGGGGSAGTGGSGGVGGFGGGSSFPLYLYLNGANGNLIQTNFFLGVAGIGGIGTAGGIGGIGANGGKGGSDGLFGDCDNDGSGDGGKGGNGGNGGNGGSGSNGLSVSYYIDGGQPLAIVDTLVKLAVQPVITATNASCTFRPVTFTGPAAGNWDLGAFANPQTGTGISTVSEYTDYGRKDITYNADAYKGFVNIPINAASFIPNITTTAAQIGTDTFVICQGGLANFAAVIASADTFLWDFGGSVTPNTYVGDTFNTVNNLQFNTPGTYTIKVQITTSCCGNSPFDSITFIVEPQITVNINGLNSYCIGDSVTLTATGANTYAWLPSFGLNTTTGDVVVAKPQTTTTYYVTGTSLSGACKATDSITISAAPKPTLTFTTVDATCGSNGSATAVVSPTGNYNYLWDNASASTTATISNELAGVYSVTVTSLTTGGCSAEGSVAIGAGSGPLAFIDSSVNDKCYGGCNGVARVRMINGLQPASYLWSTGPTTNIISGLCDGTYNVTVTDGNGCTSVASVTISEPDSLYAQIKDSTAASCSYSSDGRAWANGAGGLGPFVYAWSDPLAQDSNWAINLSSGTYSVTITDRNGCTATNSVTIAAPAELILNSTKTDVLCNGGNDGSIVLTTAGGTYPYNYSWSPNTTTVDSFDKNLTAGTYTAKVTDNQGCIDSVVVVVNEAPLLVLNANATNVKCKGDADGFVAAVVTGGTPGYTYVWGGSAVVADTLKNLAPGNYSVTVKDANNCTKTATATITESAVALAAGTPTGTPNQCFGKEDASINVPVTGGTTPYNVVATNGTDTYTSTTGNFPGVAAGNYTIVVTDAFGCSITNQLTIPAATVETYAIVIDSTSCFGSVSDGRIILKAVTGLNGPYTYALDGGTFQADSVFANLTEGNYEVYVKNAKGCIDTFSAVITEPLEITAGITPLVDTVYLNFGDSVKLTGTYTNVKNPVFEWVPAAGLSCTDCSSPFAKPSVNTIYTFRVSETKRSDTTAPCYAEAYQFIYVPLKTVIPNVFSPNGDGTNDVFFPISNYNSEVVAFRIYDRWGMLVHNENTGWNGRFDGTSQPIGSYTYFITYKEEDVANPGSRKEISVQGVVSIIR